MLFHIHRAEVLAEDGHAIFNVVATCADIALEVIQAHYDALDLDVMDIAVSPIEESLLAHRKIGLDLLLTNGPTGLAHYHPSEGWIVYEQSNQRLHLFTVEEPDGRVTYVVAPTQDLASALWSVSLSRSDGETRHFMISDSLDRLNEEQRKALEVYLLTGPAGVVEWQEGHGWVPG